MEQWYTFACPGCGKKFAATKEEAEYRLRSKGKAALYKYTCPSCHEPMLIKENFMQRIDDPYRLGAKEPEPASPKAAARIRRICLTVNHFRSYYLGEPYEGKPVAMRYGFDIVDDDARVILLGLEVLKDLQELDQDPGAAANTREREKKISGIIKKAREGLKA